ncbi:hypothetical protein AX17_000820 [Amanita inopinata Kibby_2008]|nr:hypothetical protein AX17_000820 [Amanita inopinata Kibby_2008]
MSAFLRPLTVERTFCQFCGQCSQRRAAHAAAASLLNTKVMQTGSIAKSATKKSQHSQAPVALEKNRNILEQTKLQEYLNLVASSTELTVEDIERHKPTKHAPPGTSQYESDYEDLLDTLLRSFSAKQLKCAHNLYGLPLPKKRTKRDYVISIIEMQWRWPSLSDSLKKRRDRTEATAQTFPLSTREAFLLLGKDGTNLHLLSSKHHVQASFSPNPLSLIVKGVRGSVEKMARYINVFKQDIAEDIFQLPTMQDVSPKLLQRVSRISGALVESRKNSEVHISYRKHELRACLMAKALLTRVVCEGSQQPPMLACTDKDDGLPLSLGTPVSSHGFSLYPFTPLHPLSWTSTNGDTFRVKNISGWFDRYSANRLSLLSGENLMLDMNGHAEVLRENLLNKNILGPQYQFNSTVEASIGHHLFCSSPVSSGVFNLPVTGKLSSAELLQRINKQENQRIFMPCIPKRLMESVPARQRLIHRVIYQAISVGKGADGLKLIEPKRFIKMEISRDELDTAGDSLETNLVDGDVMQRDDPDAVGPLGRRMWTGLQSETDLILPDRAQDVKFSVLSSVEVPESQWPRELQEYGKYLKGLLTSDLDASRIKLPLMLIHEDTTFMLLHSTLIRHCTELIADAHDDLEIDASPIVSESILDLNSNQKYTTCKVMSRA